MSDGISTYILNSKDNLLNILLFLESNIEFLNQDLWASEEELKDILNNVINIYYDKYYINNKNDYTRIDNYIKFSNKINRKLKNILLSIIDYYESINNADLIKSKEGSILYLTIIIYTADSLYNTSFNNIDTPKKLEKYINNILDNFAKIRFRREKNLNSLIDNIKDIVIKNNKFRECINNLMTSNNKNYFVKINKNKKYYKVLYDYKIDDLNSYEDRDINIVNNKLNICDAFSKMSFEMCYYTAFKLLERGIDFIFLFPVKKEQDVNNLIKDRNKNILDKIKFVISYDEIKGDYEYINYINTNKIDLYIDIDNSFRSDNYNMFMSIKNILIPEDFLSMNDKYIEIWKDMGINFIIKDMDSKQSEKSLLVIK